MHDAFYEPVGEGRYRATELTRGPWDADSQHAGPPSALLGTALEDALEGPLARITVEILRPVPIAELTVSAAVLRGGRSVSLVEGTLADDDGPVLLARGWRIRRQAVDLPDGLATTPQPPPGPQTAEDRPFFDVPWDAGYHTAMDARFATGGFTEPGPATVWMRPRQPVIAGRALSPLQRVLCAADSGNGVSAAMDPREWLFINTDLTVHLSRQPAGEWVRLDAATTLEPDGVGLAHAALADERGPIGHGLQTLLVAPARPRA